MGAGSYGLAIGAATEGYRQSEKDEMELERHGIAVEKATSELRRGGYGDAVRSILTGDMVGAEKAFNKINPDEQIELGSTVYDKKTGEVTWRDSQGKEQVADIQMLASIAGVPLPKQAGKWAKGEGSEIFHTGTGEKRYGIDGPGRGSLKERKFQADREKKVRDHLAKNMGGIPEAGGNWSIPEGNRERYARLSSVADRIEQRYPGKFTAGRLGELVLKYGGDLITEEEALRQAKIEAGKKEDWRPWVDDESVFGTSIDQWTQERAAKIYQESESKAINKVGMALGVSRGKKKTAKKRTKKAMAKAKAIEILKNNDTAATRKYFDKHYGQGAAARALKGK